MSQSDLGALVPCDKSAVSRVEAGLTAPDEAFARACDAAFPHLEGFFMRFWSGSQTWGAAFPPSLREFATYEAEAVALWTFEHTLVPGLLQTGEYARAVLGRHPHVTPEQVTERVAGRLARQAILDRDDPPLLWVLLDENVLHRDIGGPPVMAAQLSRLADLARRPNITVQVIPRVGAHAGLAGAFVMAETAVTQVVYVEHIAESMTTDSPAVVAMVSTKFDVLRTEAHRGSESLTMIEEMGEKWMP